MIVKINPIKFSTIYMENYHKNLEFVNVEKYKEEYDKMFDLIIENSSMENKLIKGVSCVELEEELGITLSPTIEKLLLAGFLSDLDFSISKYKKVITVDIMIYTLNPEIIKIIFAYLQRLDLFQRALDFLVKRWKKSNSK